MKIDLYKGDREMKFILQALCNLIILILGIYFCFINYSKDIGMNALIKIGIFFLTLFCIVAINLFFECFSSTKNGNRDDYWSRKTFGHEE